MFDNEGTRPIHDDYRNDEAQATDRLYSGPPVFNLPDIETGDVESEDEREPSPDLRSDKENFPLDNLTNEAFSSCKYHIRRVTHSSLVEQLS
nr:unnamed protein product [Callosobruchus analis]